MQHTAPDLPSLLRRLERPTGPVDVVLDTDTYNEVDDQFALSYLLASQEQLSLKALYAAPFFNENSTGPADGMEKSYAEILRLLDLAGSKFPSELVFRGSQNYLPNEETPVFSPAAEHLAKLAREYSPDHPLYVVSIGVLTNVPCCFSRRFETGLCWSGWADTPGTGPTTRNSTLGRMWRRIEFFLTAAAPWCSFPVRGWSRNSALPARSFGFI